MVDPTAARETTMAGKQWIRQTHRWVSLVFTLTAAGIFLALGLGRQPAQWVYFLPLVPLALLAISGTYLFFAPYARRRGSVGAER